MNKLTTQLIKIDINNTIKTGQLDYANKTAFKIVLELLHGKKRNTYDIMKKDLLKSYKFTPYMKNIINNAFEYKANKIICNIDLLPVSTLIKLTKSVNKGLDLKLVAKCYNKKLTTNYNNDILTLIKNHSTSDNSTSDNSTSDFDTVLNLALNLSDNEKLILIDYLQNSLLNVA